MRENGLVIEMPTMFDLSNASTEWSNFQPANIISPSFIDFNLVVGLDDICDFFGDHGNPKYPVSGETQLGR